MLLEVMLSCYYAGQQLLWPRLLVDVLYSRWLEFARPWRVGEELAVQLRVTELKKVVGLTEAGAEFWFQEETMGVPQMVHCHLLWQTPILQATQINTL